MKPKLRLLRHTHKAAFTLLEMSLVIGIIALVIGMSVQSMKNVVRTAEMSATYSEMHQIEKALQAYWELNGRLPCPAAAVSSGGVTVDPTYVNYGRETTPPEECIGAKNSQEAFTHNGTVKGMVPFKTLNLPDTFAEDAWGTRYTYAVEAQLTRAADEVIIWPKRSSPREIDSPWCNTTGLRIQYSDSDTDMADLHSKSAAYVLVSHGPNGYGGALRTGALASASSDADELQNSYNAADERSFVMRTPEPGGFDDIVMYKDLWNLSNAEEEDALTKHARILYFSAADAISEDHVYAYTWNGSSFESYSPQGSFNPTGVIAVSGADTCHKFLFVGNGDTGESVNSSKLYRDRDVYLNSTYTPTGSYQGSGNTVNYAGINNYYAAAFSRKFWFIAYGTDVGLRLDSYFGGSFSGGSSYAGFTTDPTRSVAFSPNGTYLAAATTSATPADRLVLYKSSALAFDSGISGQVDVPPTGAAYGVTFSPDGKFMAVAHDNASGASVSVYYVNYIANTFTLVGTMQPGGNAKSVSFSANSRFLAVGHTASPYLTVYSVDSNKTPLTFTQLDDPDTLPTGTVNDVSFSNAELFLATAIDATVGNPAFSVYEIRNNKDVIKMDDLPSAPTGVEGLAAEFAPY